MRDREVDTERKVVKWCSERAIHCLKMVALGNSGWPDRCIILPNGRLIWIEFKREGFKLQPIQEHVISELRKLGHQVEVCTDATNAIKLIGDAWAKSFS